VGKDNQKEDTGSGLSLFKVVAKKKQREDGVVYMSTTQVFQVDRT
jgi:hypothetical protein